MTVSPFALDPVLNRRFPALADLDRLARRRLPPMAADYLWAGVGDDLCLNRNRHALDRIILCPRYGRDVTRVNPATRLFGQDYPLPLGIAPMGLTGLVWPRAETILAQAAQDAGLPFVLSTVGTTALEEIAAAAPDHWWFQLYPFADDDHAISRQLIQRAKTAGAKVLVVTMDIPIRSRRLRDIRNGMTLPFHLTPSMIAHALAHPAWCWASIRAGRPRFSTLMPYATQDDPHAAAMLNRKRTIRISWDDIALFRSLWPGPMVVKGILHPDDASKAVALGIDGIQVSNHGGRQYDAAPAAIDALPAVAAAVAGRAAILFDSGIRSGLDVVRALTLGADFVFVGRPLLAAVAALGGKGARHALALLHDEIRIALGQMGACSVEDARG